MSKCFVFPKSSFKYIFPPLLYKSQFFPPVFKGTRENGLIAYSLKFNRNEFKVSKVYGPRELGSSLPSLESSWSDQQVEPS